MMACNMCVGLQKFFYGELIVVDEGVNVALDGNPHQTISQRLGFLELVKTKYAIDICKYVLTPIQNTLALTGICSKTTDHCADAIVGAQPNPPTNG